MVLQFRRVQHEISLPRRENAKAHAAISIAYAQKSLLCRSYGNPVGIHSLKCKREIEREGKKKKKERTPHKLQHVNGIDASEAFICRYAIKFYDWKYVHPSRTWRKN